MNSHPWPAALFLVAAGCGQPPASADPTPVLAIAGASEVDGAFPLAFGPLPPGEEASVRLDVHNAGDAPLHLEPPLAFPPFAAALGATIVPPGGSTELRLAYVASAGGRAMATVALESDGGRELFHLTGSSSSGDAACLAFDPPELAFPQVPLGCAAARLPLSIENRCAEPASLTLDLLPAEGPFGPVERPVLPAWIVPGGRLEVTLGFAPQRTGPAEALLLAGTGRGGERELPLRGEGVAPATMRVLDTIEIPANPLDVLFVVDDEVGMAAYHQHLRGVSSALLAFSSAFSELRFAVTTTSLAGVGGCGGEAGRLVPVDGSRPVVLTPQMQGAYDLLTANLQVPACRPAGGGHRGLETAVRAAETFGRTGVPLLLFFVATTDDAGPEPVGHYAQRLRALRPGEETRVNALAGCGQEPSRLRSFAGHFSGVTFDICSDEAWERAVGGGGAAPFPTKVPYRISATPLDGNGDGLVDDEEIDVHVDGLPVPAVSARGTRLWEYWPDREAIAFSPLAEPGPGSTLEVDYVAADPRACTP